MTRADPLARRPADADADARAVAAAAEPLPDIDDPGFAAAFDRWADRRVVLLGESTHGTAEFHRARAAVTRRLVERHGFDLVALEADWPDAAALDRALRGRPAREGAAPPFQRFPAWMWRNAETAAFFEALAALNRGRPAEAQARVHGLDIYSLAASIEAVVDYLEGVDPALAALARESYGCLEPWARRPAGYARAAQRAGWAACEQAVVRQCRTILEHRLAWSAQDGEDWLDAAQNARLVAAAERYYRVMHRGGSEAWNLRDAHMAETLAHVLEARGPGAKAVVWAHNSHVGDARATEMGARRGQRTLGEFCRRRWGEAAALIGFGAGDGEVAAASDWGGPMEIKRLGPPLPGSFERLCAEAGPPRFLLDLQADPELRDRLASPRLQRFVGVIHRPESERESHYADAAPSRQYDAWVWFDATRPVSAPEAAPPDAPRAGARETWPFGV